MFHRNHARFSGQQFQQFWAKGPHFGSFSRHFGRFQPSAAVNVRESKTAFDLQIFAPGIDKTAIELSVADDVLTVRFDGPADRSTTDRWVHRERETEPFERQFLLNGNVETAQIEARYRDGVLEIRLPKTPAAVGQDIPIA